MSKTINGPTVGAGAAAVTDAEEQRLQGAANLVGYRIPTAADLIADGTVVQLVAFWGLGRPDYVRLFLHRPTNRMYRVQFGTRTQRVLDAITAEGECNCTCAVLAASRAQFTVLGSVVDL